jgi:hypothetical protein
MIIRHALRRLRAANWPTISVRSLVLTFILMVGARSPKSDHQRSIFLPRRLDW